jgi:hypothetical protein
VCDALLNFSLFLALDDVPFDFHNSQNILTKTSEREREDLMLIVMIYGKEKWRKKYW